jgi:DNA-binding NtrC family response regulator/tetratricopeptide (TPR) repeat protein
MTDRREHEKGLQSIPTRPAGAADYLGLIGLGDVALRGGEHQGAVDYFSRALDHAASDLERAGALRRLAYALHRIGRLEEARDFAVRAVTEAERSQDERETGLAAIEAGKVHASLGELDGALHEGRRALEFLDRAGSPVESGFARNLLGLVQHRRGEHAEARRYFSEARDLFKKAGDVWHLAQAYNNLGNVFRHTGDWSRAMEHYQVACHLGATDGEYGQVGRAYHNLGLAQYHLGNWQDALSGFERSRTVAQQTNSPELVVASLLGSAGVHRMRREWARAAELYREAGEMAEVHNFTRERALAALGQARLHLDRLEADAAEALLKRALVLGKKMAPTGDLVVDAYEGMARVHLIRSDPEKARSFAASASDLARKNGDRLMLALATEALAIASPGDRPAARALLESAVSEFESLGDRRHHAQALRSLGRLLGGGGRLDQGLAVQVLGDAERIARDIGLRHDAALAVLESAAVELARGQLDAAQTQVRAALGGLDEGDPGSASRVAGILAEIEETLVRGAARSSGAAAVADLEEILSSGRSAGQNVDEMLGLLAEATQSDGVAVLERDDAALHVLGSHGIPGLTGQESVAIPVFAEGNGSWAGDSPRVCLSPAAGLGPLARGRVPASVIVLPLAPLSSTWLYLDRTRDGGRPAPKQAEVNFCLALGRQLGNLLAASQLRERASRNVALRETLMERAALADIVTQNAEMLEILKLVGKISDSTMTVLLQGETGTGKKLIAQAIHLSSPRKDGPFVTVDCAALPETLLESELFGYMKGAFTGAASDRRGLLEEAHGGTIFLDEIDKTGAQVQRRFLHLLDSGEIRPVGATAYRPLDVRILCATSSKDLRAEVHDGRFLKDLYYRLNDICVSIPPLRERREDIPLLAEYFTTFYSRHMSKPVPEIARRAMRRLVEHDWPGNVRELEKVVKRAITLSEAGEAIDLHLLPPELLAETEGAARAQEVRDGGLRESVMAYERAAILRALERFNWNKSRAASYLGLSRKGLKNKILRYGMDRRRGRTTT